MADTVAEKTWNAVFALAEMG